MKTVYYHTSSGCTPCIRLKPMVKKLAQEYQAEFVEINIDVKDPIIPGIMSVPTVLITGEDSEDVVLHPAQVRKPNVIAALES